MPAAVSVIFSPGGKLYSFDPGELELSWNDRVICQTTRGTEYGRVVKAAHDLPDEDVRSRLKRVMRLATENDEELVERRKTEAKAALTTFRELRRKLDVDARAVHAEVSLDGSRVIFNYRSESKPNVSALRRELGDRLEPKVELRSVGPREAARQCGGSGLCGTGKMCCTRFPSYEQPIGLRMAKDQDLPMTSGRITGLCGRLRCCLAFEHPIYKSFRDRAPRVGTRVLTEEGLGVVTSYAVPKDACVVELEGPTTGRSGPRRVDVPIDDCHEATEEEIEKARAAAVEAARPPERESRRSGARERKGGERGKARCDRTGKKAGDGDTKKPEREAKDGQPRKKRRSRRKKRPGEGGTPQAGGGKPGASGPQAGGGAGAGGAGKADGSQPKKRRSRRRRRRGGGGGGNGGGEGGGGSSSGPSGPSPGSGSGPPAA